ncbi:hypothetical protein KC318_g1044 [Hortaea werneckii]|uniref:Uncharacterized protein n=1 Tax=Hortaea werneckii TaxID=91943 RepID=A0A3M7B406_HORWE|nr:hypothetical protein KC334_g5866 [Hortaea werneckii]KAI7012363.1 hypothetical protein KC355_g5436 [Hortaea werneckii]KAI7675311.1 hypothetical protein KC318_g1044 [Hortaea werneckii]RMY15702.1 hypothetical protein D0867_06750 [Hortaea werneckii]RMY34483.1 hypothetical protein D0866_05225 [Hortaea werneckii]
MESRKRSRSGSDPKENKRPRGDDSGPQASFDLPLRILQKTTADNGQSNTSTAASEGAEEMGSGNDARPGPSDIETPEMPLRQNTTGDESPEEYESPGEASGSDDESTDQEPSLGDKAVFSTAQMSNPGNASLAAKFQSLDKIRTRLGRDIDELLLKRIQPEEKVGRDEWKSKEPIRWKKGLLTAIAKLVWYQVTIQEINAWLSAKVDARQQREGRSGPGNAAIRENEVYQVIDDVKAMGRPIVRVGGEDYDEEDDFEGYGGGYDDD